MAHLIYSAITSLDGYIEDMDGKFDWAAPDGEVHGFINDLERAAGTYFYGRRMYETMMVWETDLNLAADSPITRDYAEIWQAANKIVSPGHWGRYPPAKRSLSVPSTLKECDN